MRALKLKQIKYIYKKGSGSSKRKGKHYITAQEGTNCNSNKLYFTSDKNFSQIGLLEVIFSRKSNNLFFKHVYLKRGC